MVVGVSRREETVTDPETDATETGTTETERRAAATRPEPQAPGDEPADVETAGEASDRPEGDVDDGEPEGADDADTEAVAGLSWPRVAVLGAALMFLGFALAVFVTRDRPPGETSVDVGFVQDMVSHHEQAIELSLMESADGSDPTVRSFASEVLIFQSRELGVMDQMLHEWGLSRTDRSDQAMAWMDMAPVPVAEMPGMIPDDRVDEMRQAQGSEADALWLELMAQHHAGGLHMAQYAAENAADHDVRELAARMARNQAMEINEYAMTAERLGLPVSIERVEVPDYPDLLDEPSH
jgi:uncharacterized protein (DUF305 family)